jgi:superfamily II DNA/RNA helicase
MKPQLLARHLPRPQPHTLTISDAPDPLKQGLDVVAMARTGSGKTAAFVIPMLQKLAGHSPRAGARALVLSPTRELALQTHKVVRELSKGSDLRTAALVGGDAMEAQFAELAANPDVLVATPGRLLHHLEEVEGMGLGSIEYVVFDEADRLFEMGFADQVRRQGRRGVEPALCVLGCGPFGRMRGRRGLARAWLWRGGEGGGAVAPRS